MWCYGMHKHFSCFLKGVCPHKALIWLFKLWAELAVLPGKDHLYGKSDWTNYDCDLLDIFSKISKVNLSIQGGKSDRFCCQWQNLRTRKKIRLLNTHQCFGDWQLPSPGRLFSWDLLWYWQMWCWIWCTEMCRPSEELSSS